MKETKRRNTPNNFVYIFMPRKLPTPVDTKLQIITGHNKVKR